MINYNLNIKTERSTAPPTPLTLEDTQLEFKFLADMALKTVYADANCSTQRVAGKLCLPVPITEQLLQYLYKESLIEISGQDGYMNTRYAMLERGWNRVSRILDLNGYIGPAPVSLESYVSMISIQNKNIEMVSPGSVKKALSSLVLPDTVIQTLGMVVASRRSLFMFGEPGNGKTSIGMSLHTAQAGDIWIPYAIEIDNQIIKVFDQHNHVPVESNEDTYDKRWIKIKCPLVIVGGEMTIETTDLIYSNKFGYYEAPFQMKANGGTLFVDDFGRQRVDPVDLLNRWIIPLERGVDYLTFHTGKKIAVPFELLLIFATNLDPKGLVDEAFLRRMGYRLYVSPPTRDLYGAIFEKFAASRGLECGPEALDFLFRRYERENRPLRCCEPRDLISHVQDICRYLGKPPVLSRDLLDIAWDNYFGINNE